MLPILSPREWSEPIRKPREGLELKIHNLVIGTFILAAGAYAAVRKSYLQEMPQPTVEQRDIVMAGN